MGIMEKKMETTIVYWGYMGIMEKKMETTHVACLLGSNNLVLLVVESHYACAWDCHPVFPYFTFLAAHAAHGP